MVSMATMASLGLFGEVMFDSIYKFLFGRPLWEYQVMPLHEGYTSLYSLVLWGIIMGLHLSLLHGTLKEKGITSFHALAAIFCIEAIAIEALVNLSYLAYFPTYIYYYLPSDLWHVTSLQALPLYLLAGCITVTAFRLAHKIPRSALLGSTAVIVVLLAIR